MTRPCRKSRNCTSNHRPHRTGTTSTNSTPSAPATSAMQRPNLKAGDNRRHLARFKARASAQSSDQELSPPPRRRRSTPVVGKLVSSSTLGQLPSSDQLPSKDNTRTQAMLVAETRSKEMLQRLTLTLQMLRAIKETLVTSEER